MNSITSHPQFRALLPFLEEPSINRARRRKAIRDYDILDSAVEAEFDNIAMLAARVCNAASAAISFIDDDRQWFTAIWGIDQRETPIAVSFCIHTVRMAKILVVPDATQDPRFANNGLVVGSPFIRFYAGAPIFAADGTPIAALCVFHTEPRPDGITDLQRTTLQVLAGQVQSQLELRKSLIKRKAQIAKQSTLSRELKRLSEHDALTGLAHRGLFQKRLVAALHNADKHAARKLILANPEQSVASIAASQNRCRTRLAKLGALAFLAPDIVTAIIEGRQPASLTARALQNIDLPHDWREQRAMLGFA